MIPATFCNNTFFEISSFNTLGKKKENALVKIKRNTYCTPRKELIMGRYATDTKEMAKLCKMPATAPDDWGNTSKKTFFLFKPVFPENISFLNFLLNRNSRANAKVNTLIQISPCKNGSSKNITFDNV